MEHTHNHNPEEKCENCRYYTTKGQCLRYPRHPAKIYGRAGAKKDDWCGEWKPKYKEKTNDVE